MGKSGGQQQTPLLLYTTWLWECLVLQGTHCQKVSAEWSKAAGRQQWGRQQWAAPELGTPLCPSDTPPFSYHLGHGAWEIQLVHWDWSSKHTRQYENELIFMIKLWNVLALMRMTPFRFMKVLWLLCWENRAPNIWVYLWQVRCEKMNSHHLSAAVSNLRLLKNNLVILKTCYAESLRDISV